MHVAALYAQCRAGQRLEEVKDQMSKAHDEMKKERTTKLTVLEKKYADETSKLVQDLSK